LTGRELITLLVTAITVTALLSTAFMGFQVERYRAPSRGMFTLCVGTLAWSVLWVGIANGGVGKTVPEAFGGSQLLSGFAAPAFYIYCRSVVNPLRPASRRWLLFGLIGVSYSMAAFNMEGGAKWIQALILDGQRVWHPVLSTTFVAHTAETVFFGLTATWIVFRAWQTTVEPVHKRTLMWLLAAGLSGFAAVICGNLLPILGWMDALPFLPLTTLPMALLAFRSLRRLAALGRGDGEEAWGSRRASVQGYERMARGVAHDINNLLSGIVGHAELASIDLGEDHSAESHLSAIRRSAEGVGEVQSRLLSMGSAQPRWSGAPVDARAILEEAVGAVRSLTPEGVTLSLDVHGELPMVGGVGSELHTALVNLLRNAQEACEVDGGAIRAWATYEPSAVIGSRALGGELDGQPAVRIEVEDNGAGMDESTRESLFEPYFSTKGSARGLGLTSVIACVRGAGGSLAVDSEPSRGSRFVLWLPLAAEGQDREVRTPPPVPQAAVDNWPVVDDDDRVREALVELLGTLGAKARAACSSADARAIVDESAHFGAALVDIRMPGMDGFDLARALLDSRKVHRVVLMSADEAAGAVGDAFEGEPVAFLRKPITRAALQAKLLRAAG
jgi:signal transduction histidine kinase/CheY-like chemotaxis protein